MFKEVARKVQWGRSVRLRNLCAVSLILRLQGAGASAQTRNTCSPWSLQQNWEKKIGLTIVPMLSFLCNSFVNPNSALSPNDCIFFFGLGLTDRSCYTLQKHDLSDLSQVTRQLFQIWACNLAQIKKMIFTRLPPQIQVRSFALGVCRAAKHQKGNIFVFVSCTIFHS